MKTALTSFAALTAFVFVGAGAANAEVASSRQDFSVNFHYKKSDLETAAGQKALLGRLQGQVMRQCSPGARAPIPTPAERTCIDETMRSTLNKINSESLASLYTSRTAG